MLTGFVELPSGSGVCSEEVRGLRAAMVVSADQSVASVCAPRALLDPKEFLAFEHDRPEGSLRRLLSAGIPGTRRQVRQRSMLSASVDLKVRSARGSFRVGRHTVAGSAPTSFSAARRCRPWCSEDLAETPVDACERVMRALTGGAPGGREGWDPRGRGAS
jgi:hypothetical protein